MRPSAKKRLKERIGPSLFCQDFDALSLAQTCMGVFDHSPVSPLQTPLAGPTQQILAFNRLEIDLIIRFRRHRLGRAGRRRPLTDWTSVAVNATHAFRRLREKLEQANRFYKRMRMHADLETADPGVAMLGARLHRGRAEIEETPNSVEERLQAWFRNRRRQLRFTL